MRRIWDKAKKNVTVVKAKATETVFGDKKEEDPDFKARSDQLQFMEQNAKSLIQAIHNFNVSAQKLSIDSTIVASSFSSSFNQDDAPYKDRSESFKTGTEEMQSLINNLVNNRIPQQVIQPLQNVISEIERLRLIEKKRFKNKALLEQAEKEFKHAEEKNKNVSAAEENVAHRRAKFAKYNSEFLKGVEVLHDKRNETFGASLNAFQFYVIETNEQIAKQIQEKMSGLSYQQLQGQIPSMTAIDPVEETQNEK